MNGLDLARAYFTELVSPLLRQHFPDLRYAAARLGTGSDVLGLDDAMSRDHDWGLRLQLFVGERDLERVSAALDQQLPQRFRDLPIRFGMSGDPAERARIDVSTLDRFVEDNLGFDPRRDPSPYDWLSLTGQAALEVTAGEIFHDDAGELTAIREALSWWPDDLWRYLVACDWQRLDQELPLMQRAGATPRRVVGNYSATARHQRKRQRGRDLRARPGRYRLSIRRQESRSRARL